MSVACLLQLDAPCQTVQNGCKIVEASVGAPVHAAAACLSSKKLHLDELVLV